MRSVSKRDQAAAVQVCASAPKRQHFFAMDGLRGIAAGAVAAGHLRQTLQSPLHLPNTGLAVDFFFMLSGFVVAHAYSGRIVTDGFRPYIIARIVRLYPLIVLGTALGFCYYSVATGFTPILGEYAVTGMLLIPTMSPSNFDLSFLPLDPPAWSLFFEMVASILFGLGGWRGGQKSLVLCIGIAAVALAVIVTGFGSFDTGWRANSLGAGLARVSFGFGAGVLLYRLHRSGRVPRLRLPFVFQALILAALLLSSTMASALQLLIVFTVFPLLLLVAAQDGNQSRLCKRLGDLSYPLYIVHWPIYLWVGLIIGRGAWTPLAAFLTAVLTAQLLFKVYDEPVRRWLNARLRPSRAPTRALQTV